VAKERLTEQVFADQANVNADAIEVVVYRLRRKLQAAPVQLVTLRGLGYLLRASDLAGT
jgi:two-component system, OmpR family, response regulator TctD